MYEIYQKLLDEHGLKNADIARETGISNMTLSDWKKGKSTPKQDKLIQIANFFNVSLEYLMTGKESIRNIAEAEEEILSDKRLVKALSLYMAQNEETKDKIIRMIELMCD